MESFDEYRRRTGGRRASEPWERYLPLFPWVVGLVLVLWLLSDTDLHGQAVRAGGRAPARQVSRHDHAGAALQGPARDQVMKVSVEEHGLRLPFGQVSRTEESDQRSAHRPPGG